MVIIADGTLIVKQVYFCYAIAERGEIMSKFANDSIGNNLLKVNGDIIFKLQDVLDSKHMTRYRLSKITNIRFDTITNYCKGNVTFLNLEYIKIFCNVLDCQISDIIEYKK